MNRMHSKIRAAALSALYVASAPTAVAQNDASSNVNPAAAPVNSAPNCLPAASGFLRARLSGRIRTELSWSGATLECSGGSRPKGGVRMRFTHAFGQPGEQLVFVFGIPKIREGDAARGLPVNITVIRQGAGQFFGTEGDDKCTIDELRQEPLAGIPLRNRSYRVVVRGFCTKPLNAIRSEGVLHITRFDFAGRIDFSEEDRLPDDATLARESP
ncbi:MAG: hypothetical protein H7Y02_09730 [Candidatus Obscuribacterales bacterium]|nr:hypothetical protein [Steroidobacteraceae bacterium]